jgi:Protein of unknown function, DUF547
MTSGRAPNLFRIALCALVAGTLGGTPVRAETFSHADWTTVLERFVDARGFVDYRGLATDRADLDRYLASLARTSPDSDPAAFPTRDDALAYWIDAYNAFVFAGVLDRGPGTESVWGDGLFGLGFFTARKYVAGGRTFSLKQLEDDVVRGRFRDPRVHAALNCASRGCPRLPRHAFVGGALEHQLDDAMREFVAQKRNCTIDRGHRTVYLSKIFDWFEDDFVDFERRRQTPAPTVIDYVDRYRPATERVPPGFRIRYLAYDKRINRQGDPG